MGRVLCYKIQAVLLSVAFVFAFSVSSFAQQIEVRWLQAWTDTAERAALIQSYIEKFEAENPGIKVVLDLAAYNEIEQKFLLMHAAGVPPQVVMLQPASFVEQASTGKLAPLDDYVARAGINTADFIPSDIEVTTVNGKLYGLPQITGAGSNYMAYNIQAFAELGLPDAPPSTWNELLEYSRRSFQTTGDGTPVSMGYADFWNYSQYVSFVYSNDGKLVTHSDGEYRIHYNTPQVKETFEFFRTLIDTQGGWESVRSIDRIAGFVNGQRTMIWANQSLPKGLQDRGFDLRNLGVAPTPYNSDRPGAASHGAAGGGWYLAIPVGLSAEEEEAAFKWIEFLTYRADGGATFPVSMARPTPLLGLNRDRAFYDIYPGWDAMFEIFARDLPFPLSGEAQSVLTEIDGQMIRRYMQGLIPLQLEEAQRLADARLQAASGN